MNDGVLIISSKDMADYDLLKAKGTILKGQSNFDFLCSVYMMNFFVLFNFFLRERERYAVIAMIDITPCKDLIGGNKSHAIRYREQGSRSNQAM